MFAGGACTVSVSDSYGANQVWSGTLTFGGSSGNFTGAGGTLAIAVDANGVVTLSSPDGTVTSAAGVKVMVTPQYNVTDLQTQISGISVPGGAYADYADASNVDGNFNQFPPYSFAARIALDPSTGAGTPSSVDFAAAANAVALVYAEEGF